MSRLTSWARACERNANTARRKERRFMALIHLRRAGSALRSTRVRREFGRCDELGRLPPSSILTDAYADDNSKSAVGAMRRSRRGSQLARLCVPRRLERCVGPERTNHKTLFVTLQDDHGPGFRVEPGGPRLLVRRRLRHVR